MEFLLNVKTCDRLIELMSDGDGEEVIAKKWLRNYRAKVEESTRQAALKFFGYLPEARQLELLKAASIT